MIFSLKKLSLRANVGAGTCERVVPVGGFSEKFSGLCSTEAERLKRCDVPVAPGPWIGTIVSPPAVAIYSPS